MAASDLPLVLAVDDDVDSLRSEMTLGLQGRARFEVLHPREVEQRHLEEADLVLVDYVLDDWAERGEASLAMRPASGLALAAVLREHADRSGKDRLTAFALYSAHLDQVRGRLPASSGEHVVARLHDLEWAFSKSDTGKWTQMVVLADAVGSLPRCWPQGDSAAAESETLKLLGLDAKASWFDRGRRNVRACQPPVHDLSGGAHGVLFVRWLLHQVLPYPCFLLSEEWVAARLRLTPGTLLAVMSENGTLASDLKSFGYHGLLAGFLGGRWWRAALEEYVWNLTSGKSLDVGTLHAALRKRTAVRLEPLPAEASVVCLGADLRPTGEYLSADEAVRLLPDQWPAFADHAWTSIARAKDDSFLTALVDPMDAGRVDVEEVDD